MACTTEGMRHHGDSDAGLSHYLASLSKGRTSRGQEGTRGAAHQRRKERACGPYYLLRSGSPCIATPSHMHTCTGIRRREASLSERPRGPRARPSPRSVLHVACVVTTPRRMPVSWICSRRSSAVTSRAGREMRSSTLASGVIHLTSSAGGGRSRGRRRSIVLAPGLETHGALWIPPHWVRVRLRAPVPVHQPEPDVKTLPPATHNVPSTKVRGHVHCRPEASLEDARDELASVCDVSVSVPVPEDHMLEFSRELRHSDCRSVANLVL
mmetsp:Transcript_15269/g.37312  ORF Transcript_15269/g.37312 Transcript_15269/m.37312 type:complete len:268 (-) Transcript_15269:60-863(-)